MEFSMIFQTILDNLAVPILIALGGGIAVIVTKWTEKIGKSVTIKNEIESIEKRAKVRKDILDSLEPTVKSAVATNMQLANEIKATKGRIVNEDARMLFDSTMDLIMSTLPKSLTEDDGVLLEIIGGKSQLEAAIKIMIEKYVYEYKLRSSKQRTLVRKSNQK
jgi:phage gpG-like protein